MINIHDAFTTPEEIAEREAWRLGEYQGVTADEENQCPHCGRFRLCICPNGMHRCEKCNWSPELNNYAPVLD